MTPTTQQFKALLSNKNGLLSHFKENLVSLYQNQNKTRKRVLYGLIRDSDTEKWNEKAKTRMLERWHGYAVDYLDDAFKRRIRDLGLPMYETLERAAILQYDGGMVRWQAEDEAIAQNGGN